MKFCHVGNVRISHAYQKQASFTRTRRRRRLAEGRRIVPRHLWSAEYDAPKKGYKTRAQYLLDKIPSKLCKGEGRLLYGREGFRYRLNDKEGKSGIRIRVSVFSMYIKIFEMNLRRFLKVNGSKVAKWGPWTNNSKGFYNSSVSFFRQFEPALEESSRKH